MESNSYSILYKEEKQKKKNTEILKCVNMSSYIILTNKNTGERKMKTPYIALKKGKTRN